MNPYIQFQGMQDQQGLAPVFQNISQQQANQNAALGEQNQQVMQAGQTQNSAGANQLAMAMALRKNKPNYDQWQTSGSNDLFGANSNGMGAGQGYSGMNADIGLG